MGLDVYLSGPPVAVPCVCECGHEHTRENSEGLYRGKITHNLVDMAAEAGIYRCLWRPEEIQITRAKDLIEPLEKGLTLLHADPERFRALNPENGWGDYEGLVRFTSSYLAACRANPEASVYACR